MMEHPTQLIETMDDTEDMPSASNYNRKDYLAYLINDVYRPRIEEDVNFRQILPFMPFMFDQMASIYTMEKNGAKKEAAEVFFSRLKEVNEEGKYQMFLVALKEANYQFLVNALENKDPIISDENELKELISLFFREITDTVDPIMLSQALQMHNVITSQEGDEIRSIATNLGSSSANFQLLLTIPHHSKDWYKIFLGLLLEHGHINLLKKIDPKYFEQQKGSSEGEPCSIIENSDLSMSVPVDSVSSGQNKDTNLTTSNVIESNKDSKYKIPTVNTHSNCSPDVESKKSLDLTSPVNVNTPVGHYPPLDQRERYADSSGEFKTETLSEFEHLKLLFLEQTKYLKDLLQQNERTARRIDRLEEKLDIIIRYTSSSNKK